MAFEQRPKGREGVRLEDIWERTVLDRGNKCKSPEVGAWWRLRTSKEAGGSRARGESGRAQRETGARSGATLTNIPSEMPLEHGHLSDFHFNGITWTAVWTSQG